ncbi:dihydrofolate reductase [Halyomorpha halys]|uniref:dihydrofolate reductase n=1 Tax=Halyomorpha halys TaxID=286706 RepID=UPI0006D51DC6|nr:dihydrofolate reductase [Halyomorpha halys]
MATFRLIAACDENMGIGLKGDLPWKLDKEFEYYTRITTDTKDPTKQNAVVMGRKSWESVPLKDGPLPGRLNVVISTTIKDSGNPDVPVFKSLDDAMKALTTKPLSDKIEDIWIVGGGALYKEAMDSPMCDGIYLTRINAKYECDAFYPEIPSDYEEVHGIEGVPEELQHENGVTYKYTVLKRRK